MWEARLDFALVCDDFGPVWLACQALRNELHFFPSFYHIVPLRPTVEGSSFWRIVPPSACGRQRCKYSLICHTNKCNLFVLILMVRGWRLSHWRRSCSRSGILWTACPCICGCRVTLTPTIGRGWKLWVMWSSRHRACWAWTCCSVCMRRLWSLDCRCSVYSRCAFIESMLVWCISCNSLAFHVFLSHLMFQDARSLANFFCVPRCVPIYFMCQFVALDSARVWKMGAATDFPLCIYVYNKWGGATTTTPKVVGKDLTLFTFYQWYQQFHITTRRDIFFGMFFSYALFFFFDFCFLSFSPFCFFCFSAFFAFCFLLFLLFFCFLLFFAFYFLVFSFYFLCFFLLFSFFWIFCFLFFCFFV